MLHAVYPIRKRLPHVGRKQKTRHLWQHMQSIVFFSSCTPNWKEQFCCSSPVFPRNVKNTEFHKIRTLCLLYHIIYDICNKQEAPGVLLPVKKNIFYRIRYTKYPAYATNIKMPPRRPSFLFRKTQRNRNNAAATAIILSTRNTLL